MILKRIEAILGIDSTLDANRYGSGNEDDKDYADSF